MNSVPHRSRSALARDFALYIAIALLLVLAIVLSAKWSTDYFGGNAHEGVRRGLGLGFNTLVLLGFSILPHLRRANRPRFWIAIGELLIVHLAVYALLQYTVIGPWIEGKYLVVVFWESRAFDYAIRRYLPLPNDGPERSGIPERTSGA